MRRASRRTWRRCRGADPPHDHGRRLPRRRRGRQRGRRTASPRRAGEDRLRADAGAARRRLAAAVPAARAARLGRRAREPDRAAATRDDCDAGYIIMEPTEYPPMSGSNTICVATVLLETGCVEMREPETMLRLEAPAGLVEVRAACRDGRVESVELTNVPSFVDAPRRAGRGATASARVDGRRRVRRHVVRDRGRARSSASSSSRTRRASSPAWGS